MVTTLIWLLVVVAIIAIVWWALSQLTVPEPVRVVALAILAIIGLVVVVRALMQALGQAGGPLP